MLQQQYLDGFDYDGIHERAEFVLNNTKRLKPEAEKEYLEHFNRFCAKSRETINAAKEAIPGGVQHNLANNHPFPLNIVKSEGAYLYDIDGNRYIDFLNSGAVTILGNTYPLVKERVIETMESCGYLTGLYHDYEYQLAMLVKKHFPSCDKFRMLGSGTESVMAALRLARAFSGKKYIVKLKGGYHGWSDQMVYDIRSCGSKGSFAAGIPEECYQFTQAVMVNDLEALEQQFIENESKGGTAAFILEAIGQDSGVLPTTREYHKGVRRLCDQYGVLLIYDEVVTAFRLTMGGAQQFFQTKADITVFGKVVAGGFASAGGIGGREDIMALLTAGISHSASNKIVVGGTLTANPVSCVAGCTVLTELERLDAHKKLDAAAEDFTHKLVDLANRYDIPAIITHQHSILQIDLTGMKHAATFDCYSPEEVKEKRAFANARMLDFAMALAAEGLITAGGNKTFLNLQSIDVLDDALKIYERVFSKYE